MLNLDYARIKAPVAGIVMKRSAQVGAVYRPVNSYSRSQK